MSNPTQVAGATQEAAVETAVIAKDQAAQIGTAATSAAADVAGTAKEQAGAVAGQAVGQVKDLLEQTRSQLTEQAGGAQAKLGESLRSLAEELRHMGEGSGSGEGPAAEFARSVAERGSAAADYLGGKEPGDLLADLRSLAGRRPGGFLLGALAAGVVAGRLVRGAAADAHDDSGSGSGSTPSATTTPPTPPIPPTPGHVGTSVEPLFPGDAVYPVDTTVSVESVSLPGVSTYGTGSGL